MNKKYQKNNLKITVFCIASLAMPYFCNGSGSKLEDGNETVSWGKMSDKEKGKMLMGLGALFTSVSSFSFILYNHYQSDICHYLSFNNCNPEDDTANASFVLYGAVGVVSMAYGAVKYNNAAKELLHKKKA